MRRRAVALAVALVFLLPVASAQAPEPVGLVCGALAQHAPGAREKVPVCPGDPGAPPAADAQEAPSAADPPSAPSVEDLPRRIERDVRDIVEDPQQAPPRVVSLLADLLALVQRLIDLPASAAAKVDARLADVGVAYARAGAAAQSGVDAVGGAVTKVVQGIADALRPERAPRAVEPARVLPEALPRAPLQLGEDTLRQVLAEG